MGRPLKIAKNSPMSGIFYDNTNQGTTAQSVLVDVAYPPFAAPTSMDTATVVLPSPATSPVPFTGVVGGAPVLSAPSTSFPVVSCQVNIALPSGSGQGVATGRIIRQKGAHKFLVVSNTTVNDEDMVVGASYMILSLGGTNWQQMGAPVGATAGTIFTCTATVAAASTGTGLLVGTCVLTDSNTPTVGNMSISMAVGGDSTEVYISKLTNRFAQDFNGGAAGGSANTGDVWNADQVVNDIEYAANFFTDESTFAKSGAEVDTWTSANGSDQPGQNGTLELAQIEKITS
jgi:hypothetical protein